MDGLNVLHLLFSLAVMNLLDALRFHLMYCTFLTNFITHNNKRVFGGANNTDGRALGTRACVNVCVGEEVSEDDAVHPVIK